MTKRNDVMSAISLVVGLLMLAFAVVAGLMPILFSKTQDGVFTVTSCARSPANTRTASVTNRRCEGSFKTIDEAEAIAKPDSYAEIKSSEDFQPGDQIDVKLSSSGKIYDSKLTLLPYIFAGMLAVLFISYSWFLKTSKDAPANTPAMTQGLSKWTNPAFFSGLASVLAFPAPIAVVTGLLALSDSYKNKKKAVWRAWLGLGLGVFFTFMYGRLIVSIIR